MKCSILIASLNDPEIVNTVKSIRETAGDAPEIVVVDDHSRDPVQIPSKLNVKLLRANRRMGVAKGRHLAAERATGDIILITDAHMRFEPGWFEAATERIEANPNVIFNGCTLAMTNGDMNISKYLGKPTTFPGIYSGARLMIYDPKETDLRFHVLEGKWKPSPDNAELSCVMGALYFVPRDIFFKIGGLNTAERWGVDEQLLSLKALLSGYTIRQMNTVRAGHLFRGMKEPAPYTTEGCWKFYNKMRIIISMFEKDVRDFLLSKFPDTKDINYARQIIAARTGEIQKEREFHQSIFQHDLEWLCNRFNIQHPLKL